MKTAKSRLMAMLAMTAMLDMPLIPALGDSPRYTRNKVKQDGHSGWGNQHDAKTKKSRAKEKRAKLARKINWN